jgi:hypothetical protein
MKIMEIIKDAYNRVLRGSETTQKIHPVSRVLRFYYDGTGWYVDLPEWEGPHGALAMVAGADTLLAFLAAGTDHPDEITLDVWTFTPTDDRFTELIHVANLGNPKGTYVIPEMGDYQLWLCGVLVHVFNGYPKKLYFKIVEE